MRSSYFNNDLNYGDILKNICFLKNPKIIYEFGILDGFSINIFSKSSPNAKIFAFDIFDEFNGNKPNNDIFDKFNNTNVQINYGNFYQKYLDIQDNSCDIIHIDIANNGTTYQFAIDNYLKKLNEDGLLILEGGSKKRDEVEWMVKYNKDKINPFLHKLQKRIDLDITIIGEFPSLTIIKRNPNFKIKLLQIKDINNGYFQIINHFTRNLEINSNVLINNFNNFQNEYFQTFVIEYNNEIIGTAKIVLEQKAHNNFKKMGTIHDFVIKEKYRNNGLGKLLIQKLLKIADDNNCYKVILSTNDENLKFYEKCGFNKKGSEMCIYLKN